MYWLDFTLNRFAQVILQAVIGRSVDNDVMLHAGISYQCTVAFIDGIVS